MNFLERLQEASKAQEATFAECYALADGNQIKAKRLLRRRLFATYGLDPATIAMIFALIQLAFKAWKWAKDNGYLTAMPDDRLAVEPSTEELMVGVVHPDGPG